MIYSGMPVDKRSAIGLLVLATAVVTFGCAEDAVIPTAAAGETLPRCVDVRDGETMLQPIRYFRKLSDLVYDPGQPDELGRGDLYLPAEAEGPVPVVLFVHGGGWTGGHKNLRNARLLGEHLACRGVAMFDIDYELAPESPIVQQVRHAKCALRWLRGEARRFGLDPERVGVTGGSAGGNLAGLVATTGGEPLFEPTCDVHPESSTGVDMAFPFYGIYDFLTLQELRIDLSNRADDYMGVTEPTDEDWLVVSPIHYVDADDPPMLLINGTGDALVPWQQAVQMGEALDAVGVDNEVLIVEGGEHGFDAFFGSPESRIALDAVDAFVDRTLLGGRP